VDESPSDGHVLVPLAYAFDEPIDAILGAAGRMPRRRFVLTGKAPQSVRDSAPPNVHFSGFVSVGEYLLLLKGAAVVVALTNQEMTMQSAGYEALASGTPLVTSPRRVLKKFYEDSTVYAESDSESIAMAVEKVLFDHSFYHRKIIKRRDRQIRDQTEVIDAINARARSYRDEGRSNRRKA
jgi:glycosyltransferase involved in cell wall biosynthesis